MPKKYYARPEVVTAEKISDIQHAAGQMHLLLADGEDANYYPSMGLGLEKGPQIGDYLLTREDGTRYVMPAASFANRWTPALPGQVENRKASKR